MDPPKKKFDIPKRTIISILLVGTILLMFLIPPPPPLIDKSPVAFISTIEDQLEIDSLIETQDGGFAFVVAERPVCESLWQGKLRGIASFIRTDRNGIILWNVTLPIGYPTDVYFPKMHSMYTSGEGIPQPHYIHETAAGNFLITSFSGVKPLLVKISVSGEILWIQDSLVDIVSNHDDYSYINRIIETSDGKFLIQGAMMGPLIWLSHSFRTWITKIDKHGIREWSLNISGEPQYDVYGNFWGYSYGLRDIFLSSTNELYVYTSRNDPEYNAIIKFSDEGNFEWKKSNDLLFYPFDNIKKL